MAQVVQIELHPEYVQFPHLCACCGGLDERSLELAVPSTEKSEHESDLIMAVELPYCLDCHAHAQLKSPWMKIVAFIVCACLAGLTFHTPLTVSLAVAAVIAYVVYELLRLRRSLRRNCSALRDHVLFIHPTNSRLSTIVLTNTRFADRIRELNRFSVIEK